MRNIARFYPLFSSSKGNAAFIGDAGGGILIDCGVSCKRLVTALEQCAIPPEAVRGVFITHEHSDHIKGLSVFTKKYHAPVFAQSDNLDYLCFAGVLPEDADTYAVDGAEVELAGYEIRAFATPHDTRQSCGYSVTTPDGRKITTCTDLGKITPTVRRYLFGSDLVLLESNYDERMLRHGGYPDFLKQRILSAHGHLCNDDAAEILPELIENGTTRIVLGHLSQENNTPNKAETCALTALSHLRRGADYILEVAPVESCGAVVVL